MEDAIRKAIEHQAKKLLERDKKTVIRPSNLSDVINFARDKKRSSEHIALLDIGHSKIILIRDTVFVIPNTLQK